MNLRTGIVGTVFALLSLLTFALPTGGHAQGASTLDSVYVVPNPYNVSGRTFGPRSNPAGYERLRFTNLPLPCTIKIYTSAANHVTTLMFSETASLTAWDGRNKDNQYVVSDLYFYVVEHPTLGVKIGKFVVIR